MALESREGTRASRRVEEGLSRSLSGGGELQERLELVEKLQQRLRRAETLPEVEA